MPTPLVAPLLPPVAWALHELLSYIVASLACTSGRFGPTVGGTSGAEWLLGLITLVAVATAASGGVLGFRLWRESETGIKGKGGSREARSGFLGIVGMMVSVLFLFGIVLLGAAPFFLRVRECGA